MAWLSGDGEAMPVLGDGHEPAVTANWQCADKRACAVRARALTRRLALDAVLRGRNRGFWQSLAEAAGLVVSATPAALVCGPPAARAWTQVEVVAVGVSGALIGSPGRSFAGEPVTRVNAVSLGESALGRIRAGDRVRVQVTLWPGRRRYQFAGWRVPDDHEAANGR